MRNKGQMRKKILIMLLGLCLIFSTFNLSSAEEKSTGEVQYVSIDFNDVDIRTLIKFISELTNQNFVIDQKVKGNVNIISPGKITVKEAYKVFESVLEVHGYTVIKAGEISKIVPAIMAKSKNIETKLKRDNDVAEDKIVTQLIPLKYADVNVITKLFKPLISKGSIILPYAPTNTLIVTDVYSNIKRLFKIINTIDVKNAGRQITVIPVEYSDALKLEKTLKLLFQARVDKKAAAVNGITKFVADQRTNTIILLADEFNTEKIKELIKILDQEVPKSDAIFHVYYLENAKAEELAAVLQSLSGKVQSQEKGKKLAPIVSEKVKITSDKATNSLIIMADKDDYNVLETIIKKLDIPRPMVYMEALIMEIQHTDDFSIGVEWMTGSAINDVQGSPAGVFGGFSKESANTGIGALPVLSNSVLAPLGGMSLGVMAQAITIGGVTFPNLGAAIRAMKKNEMVRIISTPQIMVMDNEEAEISVGENRPYLTTSGTGDQNYNNYEYKDVGVTLKVTPQISQGRFVRLNIYQKIEKVASTNDTTTPTTLKRTAQTTVVVKDAATVVIGGLIGEDLNSTEFKVPLLGDIPILGHLFKSTGRNKTQTNLYIFLTPHIIANPAEAEKIYQEKHEEILKIKEKTIHLYEDK